MTRTDSIIIGFAIGLPVFVMAVAIYFMLG